ncbi:MAG TPA: hypothetical protein PJ987_11600 [Bacteroidia bacterium]|nr:hypothetical protein [Bacteroidia bacterium]HMY42205.1 hypothetical protein [Chitinophagales bacterium]
MTQIKAFIFRDKDSEGTINIFMEDAGVASSYNPDGTYYRTDYYQNRITPETTLDNIWDELAEGKMYGKGWDGSEAELITEANDTLVDDMIAWLFCATEEVEFVKVEMGELTEETFEQVKQQLIFEEE